MINKIEINSKPILEERLYHNQTDFIYANGKLALTKQAKERFRTEKEFNNDIIVFPLNKADQRFWKGLGFVGGVGVGLLTIFCPPVGLKVIGVCATTAAVAEGVKNFSDNETAKEGSEIVSNIFGNAASGGAVAGFSGGCKVPGHSHR